MTRVIKFLKCGGADALQAETETHGLTQPVLTALEPSKEFDVTIRDLVESTPPHSNPLVFDGLSTPENERPSDVQSAFEVARRLTAEIFAADHVVLSMPMYNFNTLSIFKTYTDNIALPGVTIKYHEDGRIEGHLKNKKCLIISTRGGAYTEGQLKDFSHFAPYLNSVLGYTGLTDITYAIAEGVDFLPPQDQQKAIKSAEY